MREVEKIAGCGRLKKCGVREVEKSAGCGRLKKVRGEVLYISSWKIQANGPSKL